MNHTRIRTSMAQIAYNAEGARQDERSFPSNGIQSIDGLSQTLIGNINMKGYKEFSAQELAEGWNACLTFAITA
jgi:hypothetical protein